MGFDAIQARSAFGLAFETAMELPEMDGTFCAQADVRIELGEAPGHLENAEYANPWYEAAGDRFLLRVPEIANFYVENGNRIVVEGLSGAPGEDAGVFLLGSALSALLMQRGMLALHGVAAVINGRGTAILGASQSGKTALALALHDRGCKLLADEVCAVDLRGGEALLLPGVPQLNAWADTLKDSGRDAANYRPIRRGLGKYAVREAGMFLDRPVPLSPRRAAWPSQRGKRLARFRYGGAEILQAPAKRPFCRFVLQKAGVFQCLRGGRPERVFS